VNGAQREAANPDAEHHHEIARMVLVEGRATTWLNHWSLLHADFDQLRKMDAVGVDGTLLQMTLGRMGHPVVRSSAPAWMASRGEAVRTDSVSRSMVSGSHPAVSIRSGAYAPVLRSQLAGVPGTMASGCVPDDGPRDGSSDLREADAAWEGSPGVPGAAVSWGGWAVPLGAEAVRPD